MNHRLSYNRVKQKQRTLELFSPQHIKQSPVNYDEFPNLKYSQSKNKDIIQQITKPHSTATKSNKKTIKSIMNSTYKKPQRKQRRNHHSDLSYAVANISKSPKNHKYSQSFNVSNIKGSSDRLIIKKCKQSNQQQIGITKIKNKTKTSKINKQQQTNQEYIIFQDEIMKGSFKDLGKLKDKMSERKQMNNLEQQQQEDDDEFYYINQFYNNKATVIQRVWRRYIARKIAKQENQEMNFIQTKPIEKIQWRQQILGQVSQLLVTERKKQQHEISINQNSIQAYEVLNQSNHSKKYEQQIKQNIIHKQQPKFQLSIQLIQTHSSLLQQNTQSYAILLQKLYNTKKISREIFTKKMAQLQRWSYAQNSQIVYLRKMWSRQLQRSSELIKMQLTQKQIHNKLDSDRIKESDVIQFFKQINLEDQKYNFQFYLFPQCDSQVFQPEPKLIEQQKQRSDKFAYTKEFKNILDSTPLQKFPFFLQEHHHLKSLISQRILNQLSVTQSNRIPVDTSLSSLSKFIDSMSHFVRKYYAEEFVTNVNAIYGYNPDIRLKFLGNYEIEGEIEEPVEQVLNYNVLQQLSSEFYLEDNYNNYCEIHNRAIFDAFNENIDILRPYYYSDGIPYPWCRDKTLTFYEIQQENIEEVIQKIKYRMIRLFSVLCGLILPSNQPDLSPKTSIEAINQQRDRNNPVKAVRIQNIIKSEIFQICENDFRWFLLDEDATSLGLQLSNFIFTKLMVQTVADIYKIQYK